MQDYETHNRAARRQYISHHRSSRDGSRCGRIRFESVGDFLMKENVKDTLVTLGIGFIMFLVGLGIGKAVGDYLGQ